VFSEVFSLSVVLTGAAAKFSKSSGDSVESGGEVTELAAVESCTVSEDLF
jgi:hypothetical protein